jgi:hypothetical protein
MTKQINIVLCTALVVSPLITTEALAEESDQTNLFIACDELKNPSIALQIGGLLGKAPFPQQKYQDCMVNAASAALQQSDQSYTRTFVPDLEFRLFRQNLKDVKVTMNSVSWVTLKSNHLHQNKEVYPPKTSVSDRKVTSPIDALTGYTNLSK